MRIAYESRKFSAKSLATIEMANVIIADYQAQGFTLTLRQLYYQFVARDLIENTERSYKSLGSTINDARLCGELSWDAIEDRTRWLRANSHWSDPASIIRSAHESYRIDMWENQPLRVEVWIEKDALIGVIERVCEELDVPYFACKGYASQSEVWRAAQRHNEHIANGQEVLILHLGDHDPSGIDMTRDIIDRLELFSDSPGDLGVTRLALNMPQIEDLGPPPNPTKLTDSRAEGYIRHFGRSSWELDALEPSYIEKLLRRHINKARDMALWAEAEERHAADRERLEEVLTSFMADQQ